MNTVNMKTNPVVWVKASQINSEYLPIVQPNIWYRARQVSDHMVHIIDDMDNIVAPYVVIDLPCLYANNTKWSYITIDKLIFKFWNYMEAISEESVDDDAWEYIKPYLLDENILNINALYDEWQDEEGLDREIVSACVDFGLRNSLIKLPYEGAKVENFQIEECIRKYFNYAWLPNDLLERWENWIKGAYLQRRYIAAIHLLDSAKGVDFIISNPNY